MGNSYFQFKQFRVEQGQCAMKVSTEACILGAWVPIGNAQSILDIGGGTGLLSLMLAQRSELPIVSVEIDAEAAGQAQENFDDSPWKDRLELINQDAFQFAAESGQQFDLIISNPPFYTNGLKSTESAKAKAMHDTGDFNKTDFAKCIHQQLSDEGRAYVLYPKAEADEFSAIARAQELFVQECLVIRNQSHKPVFRVVLQVTKTEVELEPDELNVREGQVYSNAYVRLLENYYL
ncbi:MAG: methyltransferase [Reichenbachiella sp.]